MTLYDFQLAQRMNQDFKITEKEFRQFPFLSRTTWASLFVFLGSYALLATVVGFLIAWYNYPPGPNVADPKFVFPRPVVVSPWETPVQVFKIKSEAELDELVEKHTDEYALKTALFRPRALH